MNRMLKLLMALVIVTLATSPAFAADTKTYQIQASIANESQLNVAISRIDVPGDVWSPGQSSVNFGTLIWDSAYSIFRANNYYAVDVGIVNNTGNWTLTHTTTNLTNGTDNLNGNVNVTFMDQINSSNAVQLDYLSYGAANGQSYIRSDFTNSWLRIYYGIATGQGDASGVSPIGVNKSAGTYNGTITLSLTP